MVKYIYIYIDSYADGNVLLVMLCGFCKFCIFVVCFRSKKRHQRRRVVNREFVLDVAECLPTDGQVYICTDRLELAQYMRRSSFSLFSVYMCMRESRSLYIYIYIYRNMSSSIILMQVLITP